MVVVENFSLCGITNGGFRTALSVAKTVGVVARQTVVICGAVAGLAGGVTGDAFLVDQTVTVIDVTFNTLIVDENPSVGGVARLGVGGHAVSL